jgi:uncharacterized protein YacL
MGGVIGFFIGDKITEINLFNTSSNINSINISLGNVGIIFICCLLCALILYIISPYIIRFIIKSMERIERKFQTKPTTELISGSIGGIVGLIIASFIGKPIMRVPYIGVILFTIISIILAVLCANIAVKKKDDILALLFNIGKTNPARDLKHKMKGKYLPKVLDTSVIIDGRILDICQTGFIEGPLIIPNFVLEELRHIADSEDGLKRNRGRRGLDILNKIQKEAKVKVVISEKDFENITEVDSKLLKLAQHVNGKVLTNDYNLNKVAEFQGVPVLNINDLANAVKSVALPGEEMNIQIVKEGKEIGQGIAYFDDGTMIVVEDGKEFVGSNIDVVVTTVLQTSAGRMIFAKPKFIENDD